MSFSGSIEVPICSLSCDHIDHPLFRGLPQPIEVGGPPLDSYVPS